MDELNQIQNPNIPQMTPSPMGQMSPVQSAPQSPAMPMRKNSFWFVVALITVLGIGGLIWLYVGQMEEEPMVLEQPQINKEARMDMMINRDVQEVDDVNLDAEFRAVDQDINSL